MNSSVMTRLLSLNAGFVDTVGFLGLQGLFTAHITGNFVTLAAGLVTGPGCAAAAIHYYFVQFWSLLLPVAVTTVIVIARLREPNLNADASKPV